MSAARSLPPTFDRSEMAAWIENGWVYRDAGSDLLDDHARVATIDVLRLRLITDLQRLSVNDEAMPLVLNLLDQLYALRREAKRLTAAIVAQPPEIRGPILDSILERRRKR